MITVDPAALTNYCISDGAAPLEVGMLLPASSSDTFIRAIVLYKMQWDDVCFIQWFIQPVVSPALLL